MTHWGNFLASNANLEAFRKCYGGIWFWSVDYPFSYEQKETGYSLDFLKACFPFLVAHLNDFVALAEKMTWDKSWFIRCLGFRFALLSCLTAKLVRKMCSLYAVMGFQSRFPQYKLVATKYIA